MRQRCAVHDNEDEFTTDVLYTLLNRTKCTETPLPKRINQVLTRYMESGREQEVDNIHINEFIALVFWTLSTATMCW